MFYILLNTIIGFIPQIPVGLWKFYNNNIISSNASLSFAGKGEELFIPCYQN